MTTPNKQWQSLLSTDRLWIEHGEICEMRGEHSPIYNQLQKLLGVGIGWLSI